jgi:hypothetical protein
MNRGATFETLRELASSSSSPFHLYELYLDGSTVYATDGYRAVLWQGNTYIADGSFLGFDSIEETGDLTGAQTTVTLSGVSQVYIAELLLRNYVDRRLVIRKAFWSTAGSIIVDPITLLDGRVDAPVITENPVDGTCTIALTAGSHWVDFERKAGRHTSDAEQHLWFPGDTGMRLISEINRDLKWGSA